jgi:hypothetical protein
MLALLLMTLTSFAQVPVESADRGAAVEPERQGGPLGLGVAVGAPSGITGKYWLGSWSAVQFSAGGDSGVVGDLAATGDYVFQVRPFQTGEEDVSVPMHLGAGLNFGGNIDERTGGRWLLGVRGVGGLSVLFKDLPVGIYFETAPTFYLIENLTWSIDGQIGIRYYR